MLIEVMSGPQPCPPPPQPQPAPPRVDAPMVYVYERSEWEYKVVGGGASEQELNALGAAGWELVGVATVQEKAQLYFKRLRRSR